MSKPSSQRVLRRPRRVLNEASRGLNEASKIRSVLSSSDSETFLESDLLPAPSKSTQRFGSVVGSPRFQDQTRRRIQDSSFGILFPSSADFFGAPFSLARQEIRSAEYRWSSPSSWSAANDRSLQNELDCSLILRAVADNPDSHQTTAW